LEPEKKGPASHQKRLLGRLFTRLRVTAKGLGVRYQWTSPDDANLYYLDQYRRGDQAPQGGGPAVFCASVDKVGRRRRFPTSQHSYS
jgi:hypothetical protein